MYRPLHRYLCGIQCSLVKSRSAGGAGLCGRLLLRGHDAGESSGCADDYGVLSGTADG